MNKQIHLYITGKVTGVFFRAFAKQQASKFRLVGWVKNTKEGALEIVVYGEEKNLDAFVAVSRRGPMGANVLNLHIKEEAVEEFEYFDVRPT